MTSKNRKSVSTRRYRRNQKRGVSPIIATILLVAITVVLAAVLYVLVSGLTKGGASTPYEIGFTSTAQPGSGTTWFDEMAITPSTGLTTSMFGMKIVTISGSLLPTGAVPGTCTEGSAPTATICTGVTNDWYAVVVSGTSGNIVAEYSSAGWGYASGSTLALTNGYSLWVITAAQVAGSGDYISAFSTGTSSVSGQGAL